MLRHPNCEFPFHRYRVATALIVVVLFSAIFNKLFAQSGGNAMEGMFERLPLQVNAPGTGQVAPVISADGKTLWFARPRLSIDNATVEDIWRSKIVDGKHQEAQYIGGQLGSRFGVAVTSVAPDNNTLYLMGKMREDAPSEELIYVSNTVKGGWSKPSPIIIRNLNLRQLVTDFSFGADQRTLLMAVERDSSLGDRDLYVSFYDESHHEWGTPLWLGPDVNSRNSEMTPFLSHDGKTLYFSSDRDGGIGAVDVYSSTRLDDSWQHWSRPKNAGPSVNREGRNTFYTQDARGEFAYLCWRKLKTDEPAIFKIRVQHEKQIAVALIKGKVRDEKSRALLATIRYARLSDGKEMGRARSNPETGEYQLSLPAGEEYSVRAELDGYLPTSENFDLRRLEQYQEFVRDLTLSKIEKGTKIELKSVFFETAKAELLPSSTPELERLHGLLRDFPKVRVSIDGHTDSLGSATFNSNLSLHRAEAVKAWFVTAGIDALRMDVHGYGSQIPKASNTTEEGRAQNRRVEFLIVEDASGK